MKNASPSNAVEKSRGMTANSQGIALIDENLLKSNLHTIRGVKVMLDADLAEIYGYSTKDFNRQVKNNIERFPEIFRFQLTKEETLLCSRCKNSTLNKSSSGRGSNIKYLPYAFTEQGIYMLMTVLKGDLAIQQSIAIIRLFKKMKDYIASENQQLLGCANCAQIAALTAQNTREISVIRSDYEVLKAKSQKLEDESRENRDSLAKIMENFTDPSTFKHFLIMNGQKLEADVAYTQIYGMAQKTIFVFDDYVGVKTLDLLRGIAQNVQVTIFTDQRGGCALTDSMLADFKAARPDAHIERKPAGGKFHDRYIVLDYGTDCEKMFHCGASSKDAGGRITTIMEIENPEVYREVIEGLL